MNFPELGINRHVMAVMTALAIIAFGLVSWTRVGVEETPNVEFPFISVVTTLPGADSDIIDNQITSIMINNLNGIPGLDNISGYSLDGVSNVILQFNLNKNIDVAFNEVQVKLNRAIARLPNEANTPIITKASANSDPFFTLVLYGNRTTEQLSTYAKDNIVPTLSNIDGVSEIVIYGERETYVLVTLDTQKMASYAVGVNDISNAFASSHIQVPGGVVVGADNEFPLKLDFEYRTLKDLRSLVIKQSNSSFVRLQDVATVEYGSKQESTYSSFLDFADKNQKGNRITIGVTKVAGSNAFDIEKALISKLNSNIETALPAGVNLQVASNDVDFIRNSVNSLQSHLVEGVIITSLVVLLILANFRSTLIIAFSIPVSLLGTIVVMYAFGYTFNVLTLLALLLLIGVVVDDSIIVLENIYKRLEHGDSPKTAAIVGSKQVLFAVLASTISLISIFGPVVFMGGIIGKFFKSFAVVVVFGVLISYFVSLYITPMLCSRYLKYTGNKFVVFRMLEAMFEAIESVYSKFLRFLFKGHWVVKLGIVVSVFVLGIYVVKNFSVPVEFVPQEDYSSVAIRIETPYSSNLDYTVSKIKEVEKLLLNYKEIESISSRVTREVNKARISVSMVPIDKRSVSQDEFGLILQKQLSSVVGATVRVGAGRSSGGPGGAKVSIILAASNLDELYKQSNKLIDLYKAQDYVNTVDYSLTLSPRVSMTVNKDVANTVGLSAVEVARMITTVVNGAKVGDFNENGANTRYEVRLQANEDSKSYAGKLADLYIAKNNNLYKLSNFVNVSQYLGYTSIFREGLLYSATIDIDPKAGFDTSSSAAKSLKIAQDNLPSNVVIKTSGNAKDLQETVGYVFFAFALSIVLLYMVLASQFNSYIQPFALMMPIPLAIFGAWFSLSITGYSLNIYSMIGMILLVGLVVKNSILLIDLANELRAEGESIKEALMRACPQRFRPILMTSLTVILTMVPAILATGEGSVSSASLSMVVIGGMAFSTLLTLIIIPLIYFLIESLKQTIINKFKKVDNTNVA